MQVEVHPRIAQRHPEITEADVLAAVENCLRARPRDTDPVQWAGVGVDGSARLVQFVAVELDGYPDRWLVFHSMPATDKMMREVGLR